jgi:hypothetical protein
MQCDHARFTGGYAEHRFCLRGPSSDAGAIEEPHNRVRVSRMVRLRVCAVQLTIEP